MRYLCLVYADEAAIDALPACDYDAMVGEIAAYFDELQRTGCLVASSALQPARTATIVRVRKGMMAITDGPFIETREQLAGFFLIDAGDLNDAIRLAARMPPARFGSIEIRPLKEFDPGDQEGAAGERAG